MAFTTGTAYEIRTTGSDTNGGAYGSGGVDYSQQDAARTGTGTNDSTTDAVTNASTTITSATANFTSDIIGNVLYLSGGTGSLTGTRRQVVSVTNATTIVIDSSVATGTGITMNVGGALASPGEAAKQTWGTLQRIWIKAGTYSITVNTNNVSGGKVSNNNGSMITEGYQTTRGDLGTPPLIQVNAALGATGTIWNQQGSNGGSSMRNVNFDCNSKNIGGITFSGTGRDISITGCAASSGGPYGGTAIYINCVAHTNASQSQFTGTTAVICINCVSYNNTGTGPSFDSCMCIGCIAYNNTNGNNVGAFRGNTINTIFINCIAYGQTSAGASGGGFQINSSGGNKVLNCIAVNCTGTGFLVNNLATVYINNCAAYNNGTNLSMGSGPNNLNEGFITLTSSPFTNAAGADFTLNNTLGGGADLRGVGWPSSLPGITGTGYPDIGTLQSQAGAGGGEHSSVF